MVPDQASRSDIPSAILGRVAIVGPCASGKSELERGLLSLGYDARHCAQEHSYVPDMWQRLARPQVLIYLDVSLDVARLRRRIDYGEEYLAVQRSRLAHARAHCQLYVHTDGLSPQQVLETVHNGLQRLGVAQAGA